MAHTMLFTARNRLLDLSLAAATLEFLKLVTLAFKKLIQQVRVPHYTVLLLI
jgi:hypothetical protein